MGICIARQKFHSDWLQVTVVQQPVAFSRWNNNSLRDIPPQNVKLSNYANSKFFTRSPSKSCITCHTCYPTWVNVPSFNSMQAGQYLIYFPSRDERLSVLVVVACPPRPAGLGWSSRKANGGMEWEGCRWTLKPHADQISLFECSGCIHLLKARSWDTWKAELTFLSEYWSALALPTIVT